MNLDLLIRTALEEDIGTGDITTEALSEKDRPSTAILETKQDLVVSGLDIFARVFELFDPSVKMEIGCKEGDSVRAKTRLAVVRGKAASLLTCERTALNFLQHLCGIATAVAGVVAKLQGSGVKLLDTRKTIPGWRALQKRAVKTGGGVNHRMGLFDRYMIKNNHVDLAGSVTQAIEQVLAHNSHAKQKKKIVVEVRDEKELKEALQQPIDMILLDNFTPDQIRKVLPLKTGNILFEASGGITPETVGQYAIPGLDFISIGALTHSAKAADIHLVF